MTKTFSGDVREAILESYNYFCCVRGCTTPADEIHHALHNTELNNKKYPLFINSIFNARPVCKSCHDNYALHKAELEINEKQAKVYEEYLKGNLK